MASATEEAEDADETFLDTIEGDVGNADAFQKLYWKTNGLYTSFTMKNRTAAAAVKALEQNLTIWHAEKAQEKFEIAERAYDVLCLNLVRAEFIANEDADMTRKIASRQEAAKKLFEPVQTAFYSLVSRPRQMVEDAQRTATAGPAPAKMFNDTIRPEKLTLETVPHDFRKWKKGIRAFFKINNLDTEDPVVQNMQFSACIDGEIEDLIASELMNTAPVSNYNI